MSQLRLAILMVVILLRGVVPPGTLSAQTAGTATLVGTVTDSTGSVVAGAKISVVNVETRFTSETITSAEGSYYVPYLAPGAYRLTVEAGGFKRYVRDEIIVRTAEIPRVDVQLEVGAITESVTVTGAPPLLETETSSAGQILSGDVLLKIPVSQKRSIRMMYYYPGTSAMSGYHVLGQRQNMIGYTVDGVNGKEPGTQSIGGTDDQISTTQDAFEEVKVHTTGVPAEYGHAAGGLMSIVFRSGANQLHGLVEDRFIGKNMIHRSYLEQLQPTNPFRYHETSALGSGPVVLPKLYSGRDKTFWLFGFAKHNENGGTSSARTTVPSAEMLNGDFSFGGQTAPRPLPIYNPFTTRQEGTTWVRDPFPGNQVPKSLFDPAVQNFLSRTPFAKPNQAGIPTATGPTENLVENQEKRIRRTRWDVKVDHQFTPNHKIFGRYSHARHRAWKGDYQAQFAWRDIDPNAQPAPVDQLNIVFSDMMILSPTMNNEFRAGYNRRARYETALTADQGWAKQLGIPNVDGATFPNFNIGYGLSGLSSFQNVGEDITFQDNLTKISGRHTLKAGYELIRTRYNATVAVLPSGTYDFGGTNAPFTPNTGNTFASFLLGTVASATYTQRFASWLPRWWSHQWYIQDDWKPISGLSINFGLRYSYESPFQTKYGQNSQFDPQATDPITGSPGAIVHKPGALAGGDWNNFAPRVGLAWNFRPKWAFRSSFGIIHQDIFTLGTNIMFEEYRATATVQQAPGDPRHVFRLSQGPPNFEYKVQPDGSVPFVGTNYSTRTASRWDPGMRMPYVMNWSAGLQWQFAGNWLLETIYQGQSGVGLLNYWDTNAIPLDISKDPAVLNQIFQATQNYKPIRQFGAVNHYSNYGHNSHHSGTMRIEKRYSSGLSFSGFYTMAKTLTESDSEAGAGGITFYNRRLEKARANYDLHHRFVSIMIYELPFGKGRPWMNAGGWKDHALGGWEITWVQTFQSGVPFTVGFSGSPNRYLPGTSRPNALVPTNQAQVQDWEIGPDRFPTSAQLPYLNFAAFAYPDAFTPGTLGRNTFEGPGLNWTQLSLAKWWRIKERYRFQLRLDGNNFPFKQPNFSSPNSTYNRNSPGTFGRMTGVQGSFSNIGTGRPNLYIIGRFEF
jgi:hypothetical protein